jgi:hypothetical protein
MKRLYLLLAILCIAFAGKAGTLSGTVNYWSAGPAAAKKVYLRDSNAATSTVSIIDSTTTSSTGTYSFTFTPVSTHGYAIQCNACGTADISYYGYFSSTLTINLTLSCGYRYVVDTVRNSTTNLPVIAQKVYISNSTGSYKDSAYTGSFGDAWFPVHPSVANGTFTVSTNACGLQTQSFSFTGAPMTYAPTLSVCVSNPVISGTFTNLSTSGPIPYYSVMLVDSSSTAVLYADSTTTNVSGAFSFILPPGTPSGNMIVYAYACGARVRNSGTFSGSNLTLNLSGCATGTTTVSGTVTNIVTSAAVVGQKVYVKDSVGTTVVYRDSTVTNSSGFYSFNLPPTTTTSYVLLTTASCGSMVGTYWTYTGTSGTVNLSVYGSGNTITGTVYNHTGTPAFGATLMVTKAGGGAAYATTNSAGIYSISIPCTWNSGPLTLYAYPPSASCGYGSRTVTYSGSSISGLVDTLCYNGISGIVSKQGGGAAASAKVYLVDEYYDSTSTTPITTLTAIDSTVTNSSGYYSFELNTVMPYHTFYTKAALQPSDPAYSNFLPTYHDSSLVWSSADTIKLSQWQAHAANINISLRGGSNSGGPAFIGGNVLMGANKTTAVGDPVPDRILLLTTSTGQAVAYTYSDATGAFAFPGLPYGSYLLFGDVWGKTNPALAVTVSQTNGTVNNIVFEENSGSFEGHFKSLSVGGPRALEALHIYPNPVKDYVAIGGLTGISGAKTMVLRDATGSVIASYTLNGDIVSTKTLPAGLYLMQVQTSEGVANFRFVKD